MSKKTYLRAPNDDYAPGNNIQLGHVWRDPRDPGSFIGAPLPIPADIRVNHTQKGSWTMNTGRQSSTSLGFWSKLALLPVQADVGTHWAGSEKGSYTVPRMDTYSIEPTPDYIQRSVASVTAEILKSGDNLYMITGVKVAGGAAGSNAKSSSFGVDTELGVDGSVVAAPVEVGGRLGFSRSADASTGFVSSDDFVFAYRVREIFYKKGTLRTKEHNKGAVLGENMGNVSQDERGEPKYVIEEAELGDDDIEVDGERHNFVDDDGEECGLVI